MRQFRFQRKFNPITAAITIAYLLVIHLFNKVVPPSLRMLEVGLTLDPVEGLGQLQRYHGNGTRVRQLTNLHLASIVWRGSIVKKQNGYFSIKQHTML